MEGFTCGFVLVEAGGGALEYVSDVRDLGASDYVGDYYLTSRVDGCDKRCVR